MSGGKNKKSMNLATIQKLREVVNTTTRDDWWCSVRGVDNSKAQIFEHKGKIPEGTYFLCDCIGNTIDLCKKTKRKFRNANGRLVACKVIETIVPDCHNKFGTALNGEWVIPYHLFG